MPVEYLVIGIASLVVASLTLFSGFGLGTLLMPVFALFFPVEIAIAATALVHASNNALKLPLFARGANWRVVVRFGVPALVAAFFGAWLLTSISGMEPIYEYDLLGRHAAVTPVKLVIALLILIFSMLDLMPRFAKLSFHENLLPLGGVLSGFFGGLSGHQGALRSAFLIKAGLTAQAFVATAAVVGFMVDAVRLGVYGAGFANAGLYDSAGAKVWGLVITGMLCAFAGTLIGRGLLKKITLRFVQLVTGTMLILMALLLGSGLV
ncbi:MAG: sulfite exporter TauE/SafE family protein [bacterium]